MHNLPDGIVLECDIIDEQEEMDMVCRMDRAGNWLPSQSGRRKQDHGPKVNFKHRKLRCAAFAGLPDYGRRMLQRMRERVPTVLDDYVPFELCNLEYERVCVCVRTSY
jgi:alkylated DNA repair protein alkB family protein 4